MAASVGDATRGRADDEKRARRGMASGRGPYHAGYAVVCKKSAVDELAGPSGQRRRRRRRRWARGRRSVAAAGFGLTEAAGADFEAVETRWASPAAHAVHLAAGLGERRRRGGRDRAYRRRAVTAARLGLAEAADADLEAAKPERTRAAADAALVPAAGRELNREVVDERVDLVLDVRFVAGFAAAADRLDALPGGTELGLGLVETHLIDWHATDVRPGVALELRAALARRRLELRARAAATGIARRAGAREHERHEQHPEHASHRWASCPRTTPGSGAGSTESARECREAGGGSLPPGPRRWCR